MFTNTRLRAILAAACLLAVSAAPAFAAAPSNDEFANRIVISAVPYTNNQDTSEATTEGGDPSCSGRGPTVWYEHTPADDLRLEANTFGSGYDTTLLVAIDDGAGALDVVACNDDAGDDLQSRVRFNADAGVTYFFMVGAYASGPGGELTFNLLEIPAGQEVSLEVSLDRTGRFLRDGSAVLTGVVSCSGADYVGFDASLRQRVDRFTVQGYGWTGIECAANVQFEVPIVYRNGSFAGGQAQAYLEVWACGEEDCAFQELEATIRLRR